MIRLEKRPQPSRALSLSTPIMAVLATATVFRELGWADGTATKVIATLVGGPAAALRKTKDAINAATLTELENALEREKKGQLTLLESADFREGTRAFQQRRAAKFTDR